MQRVIKGIPATLTLPTTAKASSGTLTITRDRDAASIVTAQAVTVAARSVTYLLPGQSSEANLTATWTLSTTAGTVTVSEPVEVSSFEAVTLDEIRFRRPLDDVTRYPDNVLINAREQLVSELNHRAGVKFTGGEFTITLDGNGLTDLFLPVAKARSITSVTINGTALGSTDLANVQIDQRTGELYNPLRWAAGRLNVTITGVSGFTRPVGGLSAAISKGVRYLVVDSPTQDRAISVSNEDGSTQNLMVAGLRSALFAIPELNMLVEQHTQTFGVA